MIEPSKLNVQDLPFVPIESRSSLPEVPCIYFAIDSQGEVQYIGRAANARKRWQGHHRRRQLDEIGNIKIAYLEVSDPGLLSQIETALILHFSPSLNGSQIFREGVEYKGKGNRQAKGKPPKPHKVKSIKLAAHLCPIAENSLNSATATIELGLSIVDYLAKQASIGDDQAIKLLAHFGVEAQIDNVEPIVVWRKDGTEAAWIV